MTPFTIHDAVACPLPLANIDTDQIIAARFMSRHARRAMAMCCSMDIVFTRMDRSSLTVRSISRFMPGLRRW